MNTVTKDNISKFAYTNEELLKNEPQGIIYEFHGLNDGISMTIAHTKFSYMCAEASVLYVRPFYGPWNWMNRASVRLIDEITEAVFDKYQKKMPISSSGLSMGGLSALIYTRYAKYTPSVCAAICPVCDLIYHFDEREDTARTIFSALGGYEISFYEAMEKNSPIHQIEALPDIKYLIASTLCDEEVDITKHSDPFVEKMNALGRDIEYLKIPHQGHCSLTKESAEYYREFLINNLK
ncbi:MAG: hypothetical protein E7591_10110 [Ruminococcaceae bacterium]|nr:hypothetical protein [Oscillospiraceae bacterium]